MVSIMTRSVAAVLLVVLLSACSDDPTEVVVGTESNDAADVVDDEPETPVADSSTDEADTDRAPDAVGEDSAVQVVESDITVLGPSMTGLGEWAVLRPQIDGDGEGECMDGVLLYLVEGAPVHSYDDQSFVGGIRLFNGPYGQDAFVINCEESVERVLLQGSAVMPETGWPDLQEFELYGPDIDASFEFLADWGWRGGLFTGRGNSGTDSAIYVFSAETGAIEQYGALIGPRSEIDQTHNIDVVVPDGWTYSADSWSVSVVSDQSLSRVQVRRGELDESPPLGEGDELLSRDEASVWVHNTGRVAATDWTFLTADDSVRVVRRVPLGNGSGIEVEMFVDVADTPITQDLPWAVLDLIGIYS